jgi:hypothetical protein
MSVCCECCVLSGRGLCDGSITHPEEFTECGVSECDRVNSQRSSRPTKAVEPREKKSILLRYASKRISFQIVQSSTSTARMPNL